MGRMQMNHVELQTQAAGIVRDVKTALQTFDVQQQQLSLTINHERPRIHHVANDQSNVAEGMHLLDNQQANQPLRLDNQQAAVQTLGHGQMHPNDEIRQTSEVQDSSQANLREEIHRAQKPLNDLQRRYGEMNAQPSPLAPGTTESAAEGPWIPSTPNQYSSPTLSRIRPSSTSVHTTIRKPPKFDVERCTSYKGELEMRRDSRALIDGPLLIAEITSNAENPLRIVLLQLMGKLRGAKKVERLAVWGYNV